MPRPVRTHTFNKRRYTINMTGPLDGLTDIYGKSERIMTIAAEPKTKAELETIIHESLHAENWAASEKTVMRVGKEISSLLWRLGYRKTKK